METACTVYKSVLILISACCTLYTDVLKYCVCCHMSYPELQEITAVCVSEQVGDNAFISLWVVEFCFDVHPLTQLVSFLLETEDLTP